MNTVRTLVCVTALAISADAYAQQSTHLNLPATPRWDVAGQLSMLNRNKSDLSRWDHWYSVAAIGGAASRWAAFQDDLYRGASGGDARATQDADSDQRRADQLRVDCVALPHTAIERVGGENRGDGARLGGRRRWRNVADRALDARLTADDRERRDAVKFQFPSSQCRIHWSPSSWDPRQTGTR